MHSIKKKRMLGHLAVHIVLILVGLFFLLPFFWMLSTALKSDQQIFVNPPVWIPDPVVWGNFVEAVTAIPFFKYMGNTAIVAFMDVLVHGDCLPARRLRPFSIGMERTRPVVFCDHCCYDDTNRGYNDSHSSSCSANLTWLTPMCLCIWLRSLADDLS